MEADLARYYGVDYRDRWTPERRLTLRRLGVLVAHLPPESAVACATRGDEPHWSLEAHLLDDLRLSFAGGKPHPQRPKSTGKPMTPERQKKLAAARRRARERRKRLAQE